MRRRWMLHSFLHVLRNLSWPHRFLSAGGHVFELVLAAREFSVANDDGKARPELACGAHRLFEFSGLIADFDAEALTPQFACEDGSGRKRSIAKPGYISI